MFLEQDTLLHHCSVILQKGHKEIQTHMGGILFALCTINCVLAEQNQDNLKGGKYVGCTKIET